MSAEGFRARARPEPPSAQILVVVANTLERSWRTDAEKGFLSTAVAQVLVDPKPRAKALQRGPHDDTRSGAALASPLRTSALASGAARFPRRGGHTRARGPSAVPFGGVSACTLLPAPLRRGSDPTRPEPVRQTRRRNHTRAAVSPVTCAAPSELARGGPGADASLARGHSRARGT